MNAFFALFFCALLGTSAYAVGRIHGGWSYKRGWRGGFKAGWEEGDRHARKRIINATREGRWPADASNADTVDLARAWSRVVNPGRHHRRVPKPFP